MKRSAMGRCIREFSAIAHKEIALGLPGEAGEAARVAARFALSLYPSLGDAPIMRSPARGLYPMLIPAFLQAMNDIGRLGHEKYGDQSFQYRVKTGATERWMDRVQPEAIAAHAAEHFAMVLRGEKHDHFGTLLHQLAAVAFNAMMEAHLSDATSEQVAHEST